MTERNLSIRLSVKDSEVVRRALEGLGADGQKALERITRAAEGAGPGLEALNEITGAGRGVVEDYAGRAGVLGGALSKLGPVGLASAAAIGAVTAALGAGLHELAAAEQSSLRLEAVLKATGNAAGVTTEEIEALADELEASTMASAEQVKEAAAAMATFRSVSGDTFKDAIRLAQDMAATFGGDVRSAAVQLGKALEDPEQGITALRRSGVSFTDAQRDMIAAMVRAGETAEVQRFILAALEKQVGGAGAGEGAGLTGAAKHARDAWGNLLEEIAKTSGVSALAAKALVGLKSYADFERSRIVDDGVWRDFDRKSARLATLQKDIERLAEAQPENFFLKSMRGDAEALRAEIDVLQKRGLEAAAPDEVARRTAEEGRLAAERVRNEEALAARRKALEDDVLKNSADVAIKRLEVERRYGREIETEEAKRGKAGIDGAEVDRVVGLLRQRAAQEIEGIEKPARDLAERAAAQLADDEASFGALVDDLRLQVTKVEDARAAFVQQALNRLPEALQGREDLVETVRREAAETYDLVQALKSLGEIEDQVAEKRKKMEEEGKRLAESVRTAEEKHADQVARVNEMYEAGVISAETRSRGIAQAHEELARSGKDAFGELKGAVEGWGRSSARSIAQAFTAGKRDALEFGNVVMSVLSEVLEKLLYINATKPAVEGLTSLASGMGLFGGSGGGLLSGLGSFFGFGGGDGASALAAANSGISSSPGMLDAFAGLFHRGGVVSEGRDFRAVDPDWYAGAPRYHGGKGPQLYPGEVPAILLEDEEVLTSSDPRHSRNGGRMAFAPVVNVPVTLNLTTPAGTTAKATGSRRDSGGGVTLDVLVERIEETMGGNIRRGQGLATTLEDRYQLNPANGSYG